MAVFAHAGGGELTDAVTLCESAGTDTAGKRVLEGADFISGSSGVESRSFGCAG